MADSLENWLTNTYSDLLSKDFEAHAAALFALFRCFETDKADHLSGDTVQAALNDSFLAVNPNTKRMAERLQEVKLDNKWVTFAFGGDEDIRLGSEGNYLILKATTKLKVTEKGTKLVILGADGMAGSRDPKPKWHNSLKAKSGVVNADGSLQLKLGKGLISQSVDLNLSELFD